MTTRVSKIFNKTIAYSASSVPAQNTALMLLDDQGLVVSHLGDTGADTVTVAQRMREWAAGNQVSVFHCIVDTRDTPAASKLGWEVPELVKSPTEPLFPRQPGLVSAFASPGIANALQEKGIRSLLLYGLSTSGCVLSTARAATDQEFITTIVEDACCDPAPELHGMLVKHVLPATAHVAKSEEVMDMWADLD